MQGLAHYEGTTTTTITGAGQAGGGFKLAGWVVTETAGAAATVNFRDGASGPIVAQVRIPAASASPTVRMGPANSYINLLSGNLQIEVVSGAVQWAAYRA